MSLARSTVPGGLEVHREEIDGLALRLALAPPLEGGRSLLLFTGRTEFLEKYEDVFVTLRDRGFRVATMDWRGQGGSGRWLADARRGHVRDFRDWQADVEALVRLAAGALPRPWFALAHSMGALVLTERLAAVPDTVAKAVLSAPLFGIAGVAARSPVAPWLAAILARGGFARCYAPGQGPAPLAGDEAQDNVLTGDHDRFRLYRERCRAHDDYVLGGVTWGWLDAAFGAFGRLERPGTLEALTTPLLVLQAGNERVVDPLATARALSRLPAATSLDFADAEHELMMERDAIRERVFEAIDQFLR